MEPEVLYEDKQVLAVNKPAGWVVNRAASVRGETVQDWVERYLKWEVPSRTSDFARRAGIVHRIDKETSGVLLIAKTPEAFEELQRQFKSREVEKTYVALVHGKVEPREGVIKAPLGRLPWNRERFGVLAGGRPAETHYRVTAHYTHPTTKPTTSHYWRRVHYSLLTLKPRTGRTHQIRVHAKSIGHPVVADTFYAGRKTARRDRQWCPRLFLHASKLVFKHPKSGKKVVVEAPLPRDLEKAILSL